MNGLSGKHDRSRALLSLGGFVAVLGFAATSVTTWIWGVEPWISRGTAVLDLVAVVSLTAAGPSTRDKYGNSESEWLSSLSRGRRWLIGGCLVLLLVKVGLTLLVLARSCGHEAPAGSRLALAICLCLARLN